MFKKEKKNPLFSDENVFFFFAPDTCDCTFYVTEKKM